MRLGIAEEEKKIQHFSWLEEGKNQLTLYHSTRAIILDIAPKFPHS